jgi:hypothetical protein
MMRSFFTILMGLFGVLILVTATPSEGRQNANSPTSSSTNADTFDPRDFSGVWARFGGREGRGNAQGGAPFPEKGDDGYGLEVPPFTPEGQAKFDSYRPGYGRPLGSASAAERPEEHIGRRRAVPPAEQNDPASLCSPYGVTRLILTSYFSTVEFVHASDRMIQNFAWMKDYRNIWMDGRELPTEIDIPNWNGYSIGRWEGDTLVVDSYGFEESTWLDRYGYPHSGEMRMEERYRRIAADRLELIMTITDPLIYTEPWVSGRKVFRKLEREESSINGWYELFDERCVPVDEFDFNENVRSG